MKTIILSPAQESLHQKALGLSEQHRKLEFAIIEILQKVEATKLHRVLGFSSLFQYTVKALGFSESVAYSFISVARASLKTPQLKTSIRDQILTVSKASRLVSALTPSNAEELIQFASRHSNREIDFEVAKRNPRPAKNEKIVALSENRAELRLSVSKTILEKLNRAQDIEAQRKGHHLNLEETLEEVLNEYLRHRDPEQKVARANKRKSAQKLCLNRVEKSPEETAMANHVTHSNNETRPQKLPLTAKQKNEVLVRDGVRCTHQDIKGIRCESRRWLHVHHIIPVSQGGSNDLENCTTLCSAHHELVHQLALPIEGQITWLREPWIEYAV